MTTRRLLRWIGLWLLGGVVIAGGFRVLTDHLWILAPPMGLAYFGIGVLLAGVVTWRTVRARPIEWGVALVAWAAVLGLALAAGPISRVGTPIILELRWRRDRPAYSRIVDSLLQMPDPLRGLTPAGRNRTLNYVVDRGPPLRLAFVQPGGILDNWEGVVYDPTGAVLDAHGPFWLGFPTPPEVRLLFGGDIVRCESIEGPWYRCLFT